MTQGTLFSNEIKHSTNSTNKPPQPKSGLNQANRPAPVLPAPQRTGPNGQARGHQTDFGQRQSLPYPQNSGTRNATTHLDGPKYDRVTLMGRIGRYFEVKSTPRGTALAVFSVASSQPYRDESGTWAKKTVWHRIVVWGDQALAIGDQLQKGARVYVEGKFKTKEWVDRENNPRTSTELVAREVRFLDFATAA